MEGQPTLTEIIAGGTSLVLFLVLAYDKLKGAWRSNKLADAEEEQTTQKWIEGEHRKFTKRMRDEYAQLTSDMKEEHIKCEEERAAQRLKIQELEDRLSTQVKRSDSIQLRVEKIEQENP